MGWFIIVSLTKVVRALAADIYRRSVLKRERAIKRAKYSAPWHPLDEAREKSLGKVYAAQASTAHRQT
jgi:hypothetical protein